MPPNENIVSPWDFVISNSSRFGNKQRVPDFQRNYSWESSHVSQFYDDIRYDMKFYSNKKISYGVVIGIPDYTNLVFDIIDGQQRLGSLQILVFVIRHHLESLANKLVASDGRVLQIEEVGYAKKFLVYNNKPRFSFNHGDAKNWENDYIKKMGDALSTFVTSINEREKNEKDTKIDNAFLEFNKRLKERLTEIEAQQIESIFNRSQWKTKEVRKKTLTIQPTFEEVEEALKEKSDELKDLQSELEDLNEDEEPEEIQSKILKIENRIEKQVTNLKNRTLKLQKEDLCKLYHWIIGDEPNKGITFTIIKEKNPIRAIARFDRENNRGLTIRIDDLFRSYLIQAVNMRHKGDPTAIKTNSNTIVKNWSDFITKTRKLPNKATFIQWYLMWKLGNSNLSGTKYSEESKKKLMPEDQNFENHALDKFWDPVSISEEIVKWAETFETLYTHTGSSVTNDRLRYFADCNMVTIWGLLIPLCIKTENYNGNDIDINTDLNLPKKIIGLLEYVIVCKQLLGGYNSQYWDRYFKTWRAMIGRTGEAEISLEKIVEKVENNLVTSTEKSQAEFRPLSEFYPSYCENLPKTTLHPTRKKAHIRILKVVNDSLDRDPSVGIRSTGRSSSGDIESFNELEHICPGSSKKWSVSETNEPYDSSLLNDEEYNDILDIKQHLGNHTLVNEGWNKRMSNLSFYTKKWGRNKVRNPISAEYVPINNRQFCYRNSAPTITKSLMKHVKFSNEIIHERGKQLFIHWAEFCGVDVGEFEIDDNLLVLGDEMHLNEIESTVEEQESYLLEHRAGFWDLDSDDNIDKNNGGLPFRICRTINAFMNSGIGRIILGRQDGKISVQDVCGIESQFNQRVQNPREDFEQQLMQAIEASLPGEIYRPYLPTLIPETLSTGKMVLVIDVKERVPEELKPVPFVFQGSENIYFKRYGSFDTAIKFETTPIPNDAALIDRIYNSGEIFSLSSTPTSDGFKITMGPFRDKDKALEFNSQMSDSSLEISEPLWKGIDNKFGRQVMAIIEDNLDLTNSPWSALDEGSNETDEGFWIVHWKTSNTDFELPESSSETRQLETKICPKCKKLAEFSEDYVIVQAEGYDSNILFENRTTQPGYEELDMKFGFTVHRPPSGIQSYCRDCRRG